MLAVEHFCFVRGLKDEVPPDRGTFQIVAFTHVFAPFYPQNRTLKNGVRKPYEFVKEAKGIDRFQNVLDVPFGVRQLGDCDSSRADLSEGLSFPSPKQNFNA